MIGIFAPFFKGRKDTPTTFGALRSCGKPVAPLQSRAFQGEPVPPGYAPAARYPLRSPRGTETDRHVGRGLAPAVGKTTVPEPRLPQQVTRGPVPRRVLLELRHGLLALVGGVRAAGVEHTSLKFIGVHRQFAFKRDRSLLVKVRNGGK